jgi:putative N-acetylmannosamine-6-phosphate epimerase
MDATNPAETRMVAAMAEMAKAMADLQKAAVKAFGQEGAKEIVGDTAATDAEGRARIDAAEVRVQGDTATVVVAEGEDTPVVLRRVGRHWKIPMAELSKNANAAVLDERLAELAEQRKLVAQLTTEIAEGQFNSPAQAKDAWQSRAMQAVTRRPPARKPQGEPNKSQQESSAPTRDASARPASGQ